MLGIVVFLSILFGPIFCGWICPLGSVQEWIGRLGNKLLGKNTILLYLII
ncbi:4Fe-4S binding protein [Caloramator sp. mosi_1]|nr:4Fe-4S binding protein [Caloramator sp. mosi_1]WDC83600.1 4Fe-4S binding protein [Caloramator sp. mosi_1]